MRAILTILLTALAALPLVGQESTDSAIRHTHVYLNIRSGPSTDFDKVGLARPCTNIEVIEPSGEWFKVKHGDGEGYVAGWFTHSGPPHCGDAPAPAQQPAQPPAQTGATASDPPPAPTATSQPQENKCFSSWTWCSVGDPATNKFWWNLGWCMAGIEAGTNNQKPSDCMGLLGTPLPSNFNIPGHSTATSSGGSGSSGSGSGSGGSGGSGGGGDDGGGGGGGGEPAGNCNDGWTCPPGSGDYCDCPYGN